MLESKLYIISPQLTVFVNGKHSITHEYGRMT